MRKRLVVAVVILCISAVVAGLFLTYKIWGYGILPGTVRVQAFSQDPNPAGSVSQSAISIQLACDDKPLGSTDHEFQVTSGEHTLSFSSYSSEYETPAKQKIIVKPFETTYLSVIYAARYNYLIVDTILNDEYYQNSSAINAEIFVDGISFGFGHVGLRLNESQFGNHIVSFSNLSESI
jgi:hypothetical protein